MDYTVWLSGPEAYARAKVLDGPETLGPGCLFATAGLCAEAPLASLILKPYGAVDGGRTAQSGTTSYCIRSLYVNEAFRRRGLATALLRGLATTLPRAVFYLYVDPLNEAALGLYAKLGFTLVKANCTWGHKLRVSASRLALQTH